MKRLFFLIVIIFFASISHAQLANSKWKTTLQLDDPTDVVFSFSNDTLEVLSAEDSSSLETMSYSIKDTVLTIQKLYGQSDCDNTSATYSFSINGNELHINPISDPCENRAQLLTDMKLTKVE